MKAVLTLALAALSIGFALPAAAQDTRLVIERDQEQMVEVGVIAGFPTGLSAKYWADRQLAVQAAAAFNPGTDGLNGSADALFHTASMAQDPEVFLPLYAGLGARVVEFDEGTADGEWAVGPRVPMGAEAILRDLPVSFFAEIAPALELGRGDPDVTADAALGARVVF
jgi:hypothetical protein